MGGKFGPSRLKSTAADAVATLVGTAGRGTWQETGFGAEYAQNPPKNRANLLSW